MSLVESQSRPLSGREEHGPSQHGLAPRIPIATYRLQFGDAFRFRDATALAPYLQALGISDLYTSPLLRARKGSTHGYDICDPTQLNPNLGDAEDFDAMVEALKERELGLLLDTVPNHMGIGDPCNSWWLDVLENGPGSPYAPFFDIDWHPVKPEFENKVLLPVLEDQYGAVLESGKLRLSFVDGAFFINYHDQRLPLAPGTYQLILELCLQRLDERTPPGEAVEEEPATLPLSMLDSGALPVDEHVLELQSILTALGHLPSRTETDPLRIAEQLREKEVIKRRLTALTGSSAAVQLALDETICLFNGTPGDARSFDLLDGLLEAQVYRLAFWRVAGEEINYRRFFDVNDLAAVRVELPEVFQATHQLTLRLLRDGKATGLRIDHPDGLWDPPAYFRRLQESYTALVSEDWPAGSEEGAGQPARTAAPDGSPERYPSDRLALYVVAEKILSEREPLPQDWAVSGTTGYDFLAQVNNLFVHEGHAQAFDRIYSQFIGRKLDLNQLAAGARMAVMRDALSGEINALSHQLERIGERNRHYRDFTLNGITSALREVIASLPVYRTYINAITGQVSERDRRFVEGAVQTARRRRPGLAGAIFDFIRDTLLLRNVEDFRPDDRADLANFVMKFQQLTGPVMAKGVEDTVFYIYNRLVSLNEVGSSPDQFGGSLADFHRSTTRRAARWPHSLLATSTHDNKRSEDVRARIDVLSEMPEMWRSNLSRWSRLNHAKKQMLDGSPAPDRNDEYLFYQTLLGAWPLDPQAQRGLTGWTELLDTVAGDAVDNPDRAAGAGLWFFLLQPAPSEAFGDFRARIIAYMQKAVKEAKVHTSWINPDADYDQSLLSFVERVLAPDPQNLFLKELAPLARRVAYYGQFNALSQVLLKLTAPGVPDIYQGNELWDFSLVDPDNRRPVDYGRRQALLAGLQERVRQSEACTDGGEGQLLEMSEELLRHSADGRIKLYVTMCALRCRHSLEALFREGAYVPLEARGEKAENVISFVRTLDAGRAVIVAPRLIAGLTDNIERPPLGWEVWGNTWLALPEEHAGARYRNQYTGEVLQVGEHDREPGFPLATVLGNFPVALLTSYAGGID